jgi:glycopeptide antibiotics resistance protein
VAPADRTLTITYRLLWFGFALFIVVATTAPFQFTTDHQIVLMKIAHVSANVFVDTWRGGWVSLTGVLLNVAFFVPLGLFGGLAQPSGTPWAPRRVLWLTLPGFLLSLSAETLQVFTRNRIPSSTDVVANTVGAFAGVLVARAMRTSQAGRRQK